VQLWKFVQMSTFFQTKTVSGSVIDVNDKGRQVKVAISQVGSKDLDNDVIEAGAYTKTISERGPKGSNLIWHLTDHNPSLKSVDSKHPAKRHLLPLFSMALQVG